MVMSRTASHLGIHISTLKYRVRRIHEMLGLDLNDSYNKMYLQSILFLLKQDTSSLEEYMEQEGKKAVVYREIEVKLKEQIHFKPGEVGKQLNYIMLSWRQIGRAHV